jgi:2,4-dienoyl-CoA reductase-like NADH-dependent reductase (Old Yellow Enzyme family)
MSESQFPHLSAPLRIGTARLRNRMVFTGHDSLLQKNGAVSAEYIAYQRARARGGAGLQITSATSVEPDAGTFHFQLRIDTDGAIPGYRALADAVHAEGGTVFGQLLHAGGESYSSSDGCLPVTYSASEGRSERSRIMARELSKREIARIVKSYGAAAVRFRAAEMDGLEICGNQGNLPAQFLTASINRRTDEYGGSEERRFRFLLEICAEIRQAVGPDFPLGFRLSVSDMDNLGLAEDEGLYALNRLSESGLVDYLHVVLGTGATKAGSYHIVAPMTTPTGYMAPFAERVRQVIRVPLIATGRFNTPQAAESVLSAGHADAVGMNRAMICDPQLGNKVAQNRPDEIRACIACNQACIGHFGRGVSVSCIQFPESGRELTLGSYTRTQRPRRVLVAGGGPAGMKAASIAAARGHSVVLCEASGRLGGQAHLAAKLPGRAEFGGIITNLSREVEESGVEVRVKTRVTRELVERERPDVVIVATGGKTALPSTDRIEGVRLVSANEVLDGVVQLGGRVVVADAVADWVGIGAALHLAQSGSRVTLAVNGTFAGESIPSSYVRDKSIGQLFEAGIEVIPFLRLFGAADGTVYFEHVTALKPLEIPGVDVLVAAFGQESERSLEHELEGLDIEVQLIGDCLTPRTAEEAVLDGLKVAIRL